MLVNGTCFIINDDSRDQDSTVTKHFSHTKFLLGPYCCYPSSFPELLVFFLCAGNEFRQPRDQKKQRIWEREWPVTRHCYLVLRGVGVHRVPRLKLCAACSDAKLHTKPGKASGGVQPASWNPYPYLKPLPYFRPKYVIFQTLFQAWSKNRYPISDL